MTDKKGKLVVVGTGLRTTGHMTVEAIAWIKQADIVLHVVGDPVAEDMIASLNGNSVSLQSLYGSDTKRIDTYNAMVDRIMEELRAGKSVCGVFYGHPGVFVYPSHKAIEQARAEGFAAVMLPGVSAEDCLFADIGIDPATTGCSSYEATDWLFNHRPTDPASAVVLWQIGILGNEGYSPSGYYATPLMPLLISKLVKHYPPQHRVAIYEAAVQFGCTPKIDWVPIAGLSQAVMSAASTLYIPPARETRVDEAVFGFAVRSGLMPAA